VKKKMLLSWQRLATWYLRVCLRCAGGIGGYGPHRIHTLPAVRPRPRKNKRRTTFFSGDTLDNARTLIPLNTHTQTLPLGASSNRQILKIDDVTTNVSLSMGTSTTPESTNAVKS
jgi:hypothetical protein